MNFFDGVDPGEILWIKYDDASEVLCRVRSINRTDGHTHVELDPGAKLDANDC